MDANGKRRKPAEPPGDVPHYHGHRQRLRDRFLTAGGDALGDYELLELILFRAIPKRDLKPLAKHLLAEFGSFAEVISAAGKDARPSEARRTERTPQPSEGGGRRPRPRAPGERGSL